MNTERPTIPDVLKCLLSFDPETDRWNGHCLDFDIVTSAPDEEGAWNNLKLIVRHHVEECFEKFPEGLRRTASQERWARFAQLEGQGIRARQDKIHLNLVLPNEQDLWITAIDFPFMSKNVHNNRLTV